VEGPDQHLICCHGIVVVVVTSAWGEVLLQYRIVASRVRGEFLDVDYGGVVGVRPSAVES
jgi:hypothetical protein